MTVAEGAVPRRTAALVLTVCLFALWGFGNLFYETLLPHIRVAVELSRFEQVVSQSVNSIVYFVGAIPAALYARRFGYKAAILFGLGCFCIGAFVLYPATELHAFSYLLGAISVMACGWVVLEIAANPLITALGSRDSAVRRLNVAQSFYPIGGLAGLYIGRWIIAAHLVLPAARLAHAVVHPYIIIGALVMVLAFFIDDARYPAVATERIKRLDGVGRELAALSQRPVFLFGVVTQFFCVLALAGTWTISGSVMAQAFPGVPPVADAFVWALMVFGLGRIAGSALMIRCTPECVLTVFAAGGLVLSGVAVAFGGPLGAIAVIASSFFLSITWPTVLGISIVGTGPLMKLGTALICMGGALGGFAYQMLVLVVKFPAAHVSMLVPAICYGVILAFAVVARRLR